MTQAAAPPPHLALTGANPSPPGQPQEQTSVDDPHAEVEIKPQLKPKGSVSKEDSKPSHQLWKLIIKFTQSTRQFLHLWNVGKVIVCPCNSPGKNTGMSCHFLLQKVIESSHKRKHTSSESCGHWRQGHTGVQPVKNLSCPHRRSRDQQCWGAS